MTPPSQVGAGRNHPAEEDLVRFLRGELAPREAGPIVRHLLAGCSRCSAMTRGLWSLGDKAPKLGGLVSPCRPAPLVGVWS